MIAFLLPVDSILQTIMMSFWFYKQASFLKKISKKYDEPPKILPHRSPRSPRHSHRSKSRTAIRSRHHPTQGAHIRGAPQLLCRPAEPIPRRSRNRMLHSFHRRADIHHRCPGRFRMSGRFLPIGMGVHTTSCGRRARHIHPTQLRTERPRWRSRDSVLLRRHTPRSIQDRTVLISQKMLTAR